MASIKEFYQFIRSYSLEDSLIFIGQLAYQIFQNTEEFQNSAIGSNVPRNINLWQLAFLAKSIIMNSTDYRRGKNLDKTEFFNCANLYNNLDDPLFENDKTLEDKYSAILRLSYQQFPYQQTLKKDLPRALYMYLDINQNVGLDQFSIDNEFQAIHNLSIVDFIKIGFIFLATSKNGEIDIPKLETDDPRLQPYLTPSKIEKFLSATMADYTKFRDVQKREPTRPDYDKFEFNCLLKYPLIQTERRKLITVPIPQFILHRVTKGIYYELLERYNMGGKRNEFAAFFGKNIFEAYVGMHLQRLYKKGRVSPERRYKKNSYDTSDWIVIDSNAVVLVECKTSDLTKEAKTFADQEQLLGDLQKRIIKGIKTCHRTAEDAKQKVEGLDDLSCVNSFHYLVVTADYSFLSNSSIYRRIIDTELQESLGTVPRYHVISISDFEDLFSYLEEYSLAELLAYKEQDEEWYTYDFFSFLPQFARSICGRKILARNQLLDERYEQFFSDF